MPKSHPLQKAAGRFVLAALLVLSAGGRVNARAPLEGDSAKPAFYATSAACVAAKIFNRRECDNAFSNAVAQLRDRRLAFSSRIDCMLQFHLCEQQGQDGVYVPVVLGVEIVKGRRGAFATPVLAVPTPPGLLPPQSITSIVAPRETESVPRKLVLLPTDHFERVDPSGVREAWRHFRRREMGISPVFVADEPGKPRETPQQRRLRLLEAPFIE